MKMESDLNEAEMVEIWSECGSKYESRGSHSINKGNVVFPNHYESLNTLKRIDIWIENCENYDQRHSDDYF